MQEYFEENCLELVYEVSNTHTERSGISGVKKEGGENVTITNYGSHPGG